MRRILLSFVTLLSLVNCSSDKATTPTPRVLGPEGSIYVLNQEEGTIFVFDAVTGVRTDSIPAAVPKPHHIEFSPDHTYFYVVSRTNPGWIAKFEHETGNLFDTVQTPGAVFPTAIAVSLNGAIGYVADFTTSPNTGHLVKLDLNTMSVISNTLQSGSGTHDVKISNDGARIFACNRFTDDLTIITTVNDDVYIRPLNDNDPSIPGSAKYGPYGLAVDSKDSLLYIACLDSLADQVRVYDIAKDSIVDSIMIPFSKAEEGSGKFAGPTLMDMTSDDSQLWVTTQWGNSVVVINPQTKAVLANISFATPLAFGVNISDDDSRAYIACANGFDQQGRVYIINTQTFQKVDSLLAGKNPYMAHFHGPHH